jgi:5-methylcytosine-specific restriction protein A
MAEWPYSTRRWQRIRKAKLQQSPLCEYCPAGTTTPASEVDHRVPVPQGPAFDMGNLASCCKPCHSRKTAAGNEAGAARGVRHGVDPATGLPLDPRHWWRK